MKISLLAALTLVATSALAQQKPTLTQNTTAFDAVEGSSHDLSSAKGTPWEFKPEGGDWKPIQVPAGGWRTQGYTCDAGTYRTRLLIPQQAKGQMVRLAFAAVNFGAEVFAGPDEAHLTKVASHLNGWMPFSADLTTVAKPGSSLSVVVEVKGRRKFMVNGKYTVPEGATWYSGVADGILREVSLQILPPIHIEDIWIKTLRDPDVFQPAVAVVNDSNRPVSLRLVSRLSSWNHSPFRYPSLPAVRISVPARGHQWVNLGAVAWPLGKPSYWWPNVPYRSGYKSLLHLLDVDVLVANRRVYSRRQRFGFRTFEARGAHYFLNGVRCNLRGDNQQEANFGTDAYGIKPGFGPPTPARSGQVANPGWPRAVDNILRLNFNVLRIHQIPATPYMLDVCDEQGLMLIGESPLRGSEGGEDFQAGHDAMINMNREMVTRDRNHPAIVIWSAANEWSDPIRESSAAIRVLDDTRPIIADGIGDIGPDVINMQHYVGGLGVLPATGGSPRADRPYGETESVWPMDNTWQGFAWMATSTRLRRWKENADIRNYVLNNAWPDYAPGESPEIQVLEKRVKHMGGNMEMHPGFADPWSNPLIRLMQQCYHPLAVMDVKFDHSNAHSNEAGEWPVYKPKLALGTRVARSVVVFNDEFEGENISLHWELHRDNKAGALLSSGQSPIRVTPGEMRTVEVAFNTPRTPGDVALVLSSWKDNKERFREDKIVFAVAEIGATLFPDGDYKLINRGSDLPARVGDAATVVQGTSGSADAGVWHLKNLGEGNVILTNKANGQVLGIADANGGDGALAVGVAPDGGAAQLWHVTDLEDGFYTLFNKATGKLLDVYGGAREEGARVVQWTGNGGDNQDWQVVPSVSAP